MDTQLKLKLQRLTLEIRIAILEQLKARGFGHAGGCLSAAELMAVLYGEEMRIDPQNPKWELRDQFVCSKGHAGPAVYAALAVKGYFPYATLATLNRPGTTLPSHCDRLLTPGIDMTTGSLGQGTSEAVGIALAKRIKKQDCNVFLLVGDGESNEGQVWEAAMFSTAKKLDNLFWFVDVNRKQLDGFTEDVLNPFSFYEKMKAFGFDTYEVNGNDVEELYNTIEKAKTVKGKPHAIVMNTVKGNGVPEIIDMFKNHGVNTTEDNWIKWQSAVVDELKEFDKMHGEVL